MIRLLFAFFFLLFSQAAFSQNSKKIDKLLGKNEFQEARKQLGKAIQKHPENAAVEYLFAKYYLNKEQNSIPYLDSAYSHALQSIRLLENPVNRDKKTLAKIGISKNNIKNLKKSIDSLAFELTLQKNQVVGFQYFLDQYPTAIQTKEAEEKRDELAFQIAFQSNQPDSLKYFFEKYPQAKQVVEAKKRYETLLFEIQTQNGTLKDFEDFISKNPDSPYLLIAEKNVFQLSTLAHTPESYEYFINKYPQNRFQNVACQWLYQLFTEDHPPEFFFKKYPVFKNDIAWQNRVLMNQMMLFPVLEDEKYGFMDMEGNMKISPQYDSVATDYFCEGIKENNIKIYVKSHVQLVDKTGKKLLEGYYSDVKNLEMCLWQLTSSGKKGLIHETGFEILPAIYDSIFALGEKLVIATQHDKVQIFSKNGRGLLELKNVTIQTFEDSLLIIKNNAKYALIDYKELLSEKHIFPDFKYDSVSFSESNQLKLKKDTLEFLIFSSKNTKSVWIDTVMVSRILIKLQKEFVKVEKSGDFYKVKNKKGKAGLFRLNGEVVFPPKFEELDPWNGNLFKIKQNGKFGLINEKGKSILQPTFDGVENLGKEFVATLKNVKFGLIKFNTPLNIKPLYESLIVSYDPLEKYFTAKKNGKSGLITSGNKPVTDFIFDEINYWQPSVALVRQNELWQLYQIEENRFMYKPFEQITYLQNDENQKLIKVYSDKKYGLLSNKKGILVDFEYDDLNNVGTIENPFYVAEKQLRDVDIYLLYYLNRNAEPVRRQVLTSELYEKISCD